MINEYFVAIGISIAGSLMAAGALWFFRRQLQELVSGLDMSTGAVLGWIMAFILLTVLVVFTVLGIELPSVLTTVFVILIAFLVMETVNQRRQG